MFEYDHPVPGVEQRRVTRRDRDQLTGRPDVRRIGDLRLVKPRVVDVVVDPARVVQQLADRDVAAVRNQSGQPVFDGIVECQLPLADELQHDRRDERLRDARDPEACRGTQLDSRVSAREPARRAPDLCRRSKYDERSRRTVMDEPLTTPASVGFRCCETPWAAPPTRAEAASVSTRTSVGCSPGGVARVRLRAEVG